jgi:hypothetical protein
MFFSMNMYVAAGNTVKDTTIKNAIVLLTVCDIVSYYADYNWMRQAIK